MLKDILRFNKEPSRLESAFKEGDIIYLKERLALVATHYLIPMGSAICHELEQMMDFPISLFCSLS